MLLMSETPSLSLSLLYKLSQTISICRTFCGRIHQSGLVDGQSNPLLYALITKHAFTYPLALWPLLEFIPFTLLSLSSNLIKSSWSIQVRKHISYSVFRVIDSHAAWITLLWWRPILVTSFPCNRHGDTRQPLIRRQSMTDWLWHQLPYVSKSNHSKFSAPCLKNVSGKWYMEEFYKLESIQFLLVEPI